MPIKSSAASDARALVKALSAEDEVAREAAIARLAVMGDRAIPYLLNTYSATSDRRARTVLLRTMEPAGDDRTLGIARDALREGGDLAVCAAAVLRGLLESPRGTTAADALDGLMNAALDVTAERRVRLATIDALESITGNVRQRINAALANDPDRVIRKRVASGASSDIDADAIWTDALEGHLPDTPLSLTEILQARGSHAPLSELRNLVDRVRDRERESSATTAREWQAFRGTIHQVLALRGSRVALYDLRETVERATPELPTSFVAALQTLGDRPCLDALAAAFSRSAPSDQHWRHMLAGAFRVISMREKAAKRPAVMKRISALWPEAQELIRNSQ